MISDAKSTDQKSIGTKPVQAKEGPGGEELEDRETYSRGCRRNEERRKRDIEEDEELKKYRGGRGVKGI